ncbi:MAG: DUF4266 domain-containing protein [Gammaproteobacteria bacterium]|nr:DUF4266 domain-containing protein [Gammaproteobacteria bacterium]
MKRCSIGVLGLLLACIFVNGCAEHVQPWERGRLARREMAIAPSPALSALRAHIHDSREAASGGIGVQAGGCGCR